MPLGFSKELYSPHRAGVGLLQTVMMRILIVEDEEHLADLLAEVLGREGHVANTASDGRSGATRSGALESASTLRPRSLLC